MDEKPTYSRPVGEREEAVHGERGKCSRVRRLLRWTEHVFVAICLIAITLMFTPVPRWLYLGLDREDPLEKADYIICLGGNSARVIEAARLLRECYAPTLIVSNNGDRADMMQILAVDWGAPPDRILVDRDSTKTADHPGAVALNCGVDPSADRCIIVTSMSHMARSEAVFEKAGYRHIQMHEPRWEREFRLLRGWRSNILIAGELLYEYAARLQYWVMGYT